MSNRLNQEREAKLQPQRMEYAKQQLQAAGKVIARESNTTLQFFHKDKMITFYPYSGWASGKTIKDCRGIENLIKQLK